MRKSIAAIAWLPVTIAMVCWSFSFIWYKHVFVYYGPVTTTVLRLTFAIPLLIAGSLVLRKLQVVRKEHVKWFALLGFFEPFLYFVGESYGVSLISPTLAAIIISLIPLLSPFPARYFLKEKITWVNYMGILISVAGVSLFVLGDNQPGDSRLSGIFLMLLAVVSAIFYTLMARKLTDHYSVFTIVSYQSVFGWIYFIPLFLFTELRSFAETGLVFEGLWPAFKLAVFASSVAFLLYVYSIRQLGMARTNVFVNLIPVCTAILSWMILNENFGWLKMMGLAVVVGGLVFSQAGHAVMQERPEY